MPTWTVDIVTQIPRMKMRRVQNRHYGRSRGLIRLGGISFTHASAQALLSQCLRHFIMRSG